MSVSIMPGAITFTVIAARRHLARQRLGEADQPGLRRRVVGLARRSPSGPTTELIAMIRPPRCFSIGRIAACVSTKRRGQVRREHGVPVVALHPHQQLIARDAGVADQDVEPPVPLDDAAGHALERGRVGDVDAQRLGPAAARRDARRRTRRRGRRAPRRRPSRPARRAAPAIARPMPRDAPVTSATLPDRSNIGDGRLDDGHGGFDGAARSSGAAEADRPWPRGESCAPGRSTPCPDPPQHTL